MKKIKIIFLMLCIAFISPSIVYIFNGKGIQNLVSSFTFFYTQPTTDFILSKICGSILFLGLFIGIVCVYLKILKHHEKLFKSNKELITFILIVVCLFFIMLPLTSTDVFYYIGTGWSEAHYDINPYYTSVDELMANKQEAANDGMLLKMKGIWSNQTIVYGPIWPLICRILSGLSMENLSLALYIYKFFNVIIHLINTYLIYKICKNKKKFALMYALNPLVLFEGVVNVHNEIVVLFFILLGIYFLVRKKNIPLTILFFALATAIKYFAILLLPFLVLYYYRKEKIIKKVLYSFLWAMLFISILALCYLIYMRDISILKGVLTQQGKFGNSIFIFVAINNIDLALNISKGFMLAYIIIYIVTIIKLLISKKQYSFSYYIRQYNELLLLFIFGTITQFQSWYILWLMPTIMWLKSKDIKWMIWITAIVQIANIVYFIFDEYYVFGIYYCILMYTLMLLSNILCERKHCLNKERE